MTKRPADDPQQSQQGQGTAMNTAADVSTETDVRAMRAPVARAVQTAARVLYDAERQTPMTQPEIGDAVTRELPPGSRFSVVPSTLYRYRFFTHCRHMAVEVFFALLQVCYRDVAGGLEALARAIREETGSVEQQSERAGRREALLGIFDRLNDREQEVALGMMRGILGPLAGSLPSGREQEDAAADARLRAEELAAVDAELADAGRTGTARQTARRMLAQDEPGAGGGQPLRRQGNGC